MRTGRENLEFPSENPILGATRLDDGGGAFQCAEVISGAGNVLRSTVSRLLAKDAVFHRVQQALLSTRDLRRAVDRNVGRLFAGLNIPSHQEVDRLYDDIRALEKQLSALTARTEALVSALDPPPDR